MAARLNWVRSITQFQVQFLALPWRVAVSRDPLSKVKIMLERLKSWHGRLRRIPNIDWRQKREVYMLIQDLGTAIEAEAWVLFAELVQRGQTLIAKLRSLESMAQEKETAP